MSARQSSLISDWNVCKTIKSNQRLKCLQDNQVQSVTEMSWRHLSPIKDWKVLKTFPSAIGLNCLADNYVPARTDMSCGQKGSASGPYSLQDKKSPFGDLNVHDMKVQTRDTFVCKTILYYIWTELSPCFKTKLSRDPFVQKQTQMSKIGLKSLPLVFDNATSFWHRPL